MNNYKIYRKDNYIVVTNDATLETYYGHIKDVMVDKSNTNRPSYRFFNIKDLKDGTSLAISQILQEDGSDYTVEDFDTFYTQNTGNFNGGGSAPTGVQSVTGDGVDNTDPQNPVITGGSQDLQSVLANGGITEDVSFSLKIGYNSLEFFGTGLYGGTTEHTDSFNLLSISDRIADGTASYQFDPEKPEGTYILATTDDILSGATIVNMNGTDTVFNIPHGMGVTPASFSISFGDASNLNFVQSSRTLDDTNITLTCTAPPLAGSQTVYWQVFK